MSDVMLFGDGTFALHSVGMSIGVSVERSNVHAVWPGSLVTWIVVVACLLIKLLVGWHALPKDPPWDLMHQASGTHMWPELVSTVGATATRTLTLRSAPCDYHYYDFWLMSW